MKMKDFREVRNMSFAKRGMRVEHTYNGKKGRIAGANASANLNIIFDGENFSVNCHPHFMMRYYDKKGQLLKEYGR
jgi:hypothetical protein